MNNFCKRYNMFPESGIVLCAVSGGKDSIFLLSRMIELAPDYGFTVHSAHFNHRLRGKEADRDQNFVENFCAARHIPCHVGSADALAFARENKMGTEEAARALRYAFLEKTAENIGAARIATAHTADDNVETMLLNLIRGSGLKGVCAVPPRRGKIIRPLLNTTSAEILSWLNERGIDHIEDSSNQEPFCARNRIRQNVIPLLELESPGFISRAARSLLTLREDEEYLTELAMRFIDENLVDDSLPVSEFADLARPLSARVTALLAGSELSQRHIDAVRALADRDGKTRARADLPGMRVFREHDKLRFGKAKEEAEAAIKPRTLKIPGLTEIDEAGLRIKCELILNCREINNSLNIFTFKSDSICGKLSVASRFSGAKIRLAGRGCTKSLKKLFSEAQVSCADRDLIPVLRDEEGLVAVYGFGIAQRCMPEPGDDVIKVQITDIF